MSNRLERDIFGGSDSELSSEEEELPEERHEKRAPSPVPAPIDDESSGDSADDYVQEKRVKKKKKVRRQDDDGERPVQRKRRRKVQQVVEQDLESLPPEQARKLQVQMKIDAIVKAKKNNRPKKRKKDADEEVLDRFADEEVTQLREEMLRAAAEDDYANREKLPAMSKLKLLPRVKEVLQKASLAQSIMDNNLLEGVRRWLEPLPDRSLPALNIQTFLVEQLVKMYIDTNTLKESGLGRVVLFYTKCKRVTPPIARMAHNLVSIWSRPIIKRSSSYRDVHIPTAQRGDDEQRVPTRLNTILARARDENVRAARKNVVSIPKNEGFGQYTIAPRSNMTLSKVQYAGVDVDIERRKRAAERMKNFMKKTPGKL